MYTLFHTCTLECGVHIVTLDNVAHHDESETTSVIALNLLSRAPWLTNN